MDYGIDTLSNGERGFVIFAIFIIFFIFFTFFVTSYLSFKKERDYIKIEMSRSFSEEEYLYWRDKLKMFYISKIPIIRSVVKSKYNR